jgi:hypothetical protein
VDLEKIDARWERAKTLWGKTKRFWGKCKVVIGTVLFFGVVIAAVIFVPYMIWDIAVHPEVRHATASGVYRQMKWYLLWAAISWVGKFWRKKSTEPEEIESGTLHQASIQGSQPKDRRKNHRRVQGRR